MADDGWARLGAAIARDRAGRWPSREKFGKAAGVSRRLLDDLETGSRDRYSTRTFRLIEAALGWTPGTCERIVAGGQPRYLIDPQLARIIDAWPRLSRDARTMVVELVERAQSDGR